MPTPRGGRRSFVRAGARPSGRRCLEHPFTLASMSALPSPPFRSAGRFNLTVQKRCARTSDSSTIIVSHCSRSRRLVLGFSAPASASDYVRNGVGSGMSASALRCLEADRQQAAHKRPGCAPPARDANWSDPTASNLEFKSELMPRRASHPPRPPLRLG